jgi:hypothetical protein
MFNNFSNPDEPNDFSFGVEPAHEPSFVWGQRKSVQPQKKEQSS